MPATFLRTALSLPILFAIAAAAPVTVRAQDDAWQVFYDAGEGFLTTPDGAWLGEGTRSEWTDEGLRVLDETTAAGSGRLYHCNWGVAHGTEAQVLVRVRVDAASEAWGACVNVADGVVEEDVSFFPDKVILSYAGIEAPFPVGEGLHTYRIELKAPDIRVFADDALLLNGDGVFTHPVLTPGRNRVAFGASASTATSDSTWHSVAFRPRSDAPLAATPAGVAGLRITRGETVPIREGARFVSMFRFSSGALQAAGKRSTDGGKTWTDSPGPWVGACQLPDGEVISLDYRTHAAAEKGWFTSDLTRFDASGAPLPTLQARLYVPELVPFVDDDGSTRDGPWCDHAIIVLKDQSLLAANCGCFASDTTPVSSCPGQFKASKYRGFVTRSTDRGLTWEYLSTVTADATLGSEGCNEMDLIRTPEGDILCIYRTGGDRAHPSPLYQSRSKDEGKTWGPPERIADRGVWPNTCLMDDGVLVCTYGRPGNWLTFSLDSGRTWLGHFCFYEGGTTSYNSVEQVATGRILVMYDRQTFDRAGNPVDDVVGTFFEVQRR